MSHQTSLCFSADMRWNDRSVVDTIEAALSHRSGKDSDGGVVGSDGGLGEGDSQVVVLSQVVVVELDEALDGLLHWAHLYQSHLVVFPKGQTNRKSSDSSQEVHGHMIKHGETYMGLWWGKWQSPKLKGKDEVRRLQGSDKSFRAGRAQCEDGDLRPRWDLRRGEDSGRGPWGEDAGRGERTQDAGLGERTGRLGGFGTWTNAISRTMRKWLYGETKTGTLGKE